jgi:hypothetical protein
MRIILNLFFFLLITIKCIFINSEEYTYKLISEKKSTSQHTSKNNIGKK